MANVELPVEIISDILTRLTVKPLTRFKYVSKAWNSLISSSSFITHHFKSNPNPKIIVASEYSLFSASIPDHHHHNNNNLYFSNFNHSLKLLPYGRVNVIHSCNGILLISNTTMDTTFICNPANNTYRLVPSIRGRIGAFFGFGYDSHKDDYKVLKVFQKPGVSVEICVYSLREHFWQHIKLDTASMEEYFLIPFPHCAVGANGVLYFVAATKEHKPMLRCFDFTRTDSFSRVDYPELDRHDLKKVSMSFRKLHGFMCLLVNYYREGNQELELLYVDVLEMREYGKKASWVKLFRIRNGEIVGKGGLWRYFRLIAYLKDKRKVLLEVNCAWFGWYDLVTKSLNKVKTHGLPVEDKPHVVTTYVESLICV